jgi:hypothetical protein
VYDAPHDPDIDESTPPHLVTVRELAELVDLTRRAQREISFRQRTRRPTERAFQLAGSYESRLDAVVAGLLRQAPDRPTLAVPVWTPPFSRARLLDLLAALGRARRERAALRAQRLDGPDAR